MKKILKATMTIFGAGCFGCLAALICGAGAHAVVFVFKAGWALVKF